MCGDSPDHGGCMSGKAVRKTRTRRVGSLVPEVREVFTQKAKDNAMDSVLYGMVNGRTLADVCVELGLNPGTVREWFMVDEDRAFQYRTARMLMGQALVDEALDTARKTTSKTVGQDKLRIDTLLWTATRINRKEFSEKHADDGGGSTIEIRIVEEGAPKQYNASIRKTVEADFTPVE